MGKFNEYSQKATPADNDTLMIYDATSKANKLSPFSGIWNWIVGKLTNAVISNLETQNKSVIGALNELNSKTQTVVNTEYLNANTNFCNIQDGLYSFNINSTNTAPAEYKQPPKSIGDGIIIVKTYRTYQTMCCIGFKGIAVAQKNTKTNKIETEWNILYTKQ